jgi:hypothetical protein
MGFIDFITSPKIIWLFVVAVLLYFLFRLFIPKAVEGNPLH